jgi:hypothetical protein
MPGIEQLDAKRIIEEGPGPFSGLTRAGPPSPPLRADDTGNVAHEAVFAATLPRRIRAVILAFRNRRYLKTLSAEALAGIGSDGRVTLGLNGEPLPFTPLVERGSAVRSATRAASDWVWVRLDFGPRALVAGDRLCVSFRFDEHVRVPVVAIRYLVPLFLVDENDVWHVEEPMVVSVVGAPAVRLCADVPSIVLGGHLLLRVSALDQYGNLDPTFSDDLVCTLGGQEVRLRASEGRAESRALAVPFEGMHRVKLHGLTSRIEAVSNCFLVDPAFDGRRLVWGDFHGHSISSDGIGTMDEHYAYARDVRFMDVAALTDHDNQIIANGAWPLIQQTARRWTDPGSFVVLPGYEWAQPYEAERNYGHKNLYFRTYEDNPLLSGDAADATGAETPDGLYAGLTPEQCVIVSHHPAYDSWMWTDWDLLRGDREEVIEVYSMHGASDEVDTIKPLPDFNAGRFILPNLRARPGLRLGFVGGSDTHAGLIAQDFHPDRAAPEVRRWFKPYRGGLTAFLVHELTLDGVLDALRGRRTYATTGEKLLLLVEVNGHLFQPEVTGGKASLRVRFGGSAPVRRLEVYRNAQRCHLLEDLDETFEYHWEDPCSEPPAFYFVRVTQTDDQIAWSAVTWVG